MKSFAVLSLFACLIHVSHGSMADDCDEIDLALIVDCSSSINTDEFSKMVDFIETEILAQIDLSKTRVGLATFSEDADSEIDFGDYRNKQDLENEVKYRLDRCQRGAATNLQRGIEEASGLGGNRADKQDVYLLISDGSENEGSALPVATRLKDDGAVFIAVGAGDESSVLVDFLSDIASYPEYFSMARDFDFNENLVNEVISMLCYPNQGPCGAMDLVIVVDCSSSIDASEWRELKSFLMNDIISYVRMDGTRVSLVTFNDKENVIFDLDRYTTIDEVQSVVSRLTCDNRIAEKQTNIARAITKASLVRGNRADVPNVMLLMSDGAENLSYHDQYGGEAAEDLKKNGWFIVTAGVGERDYVRDHEDILISIASRETLYHEIPDFDFTEDVVDAIANDLCYAPTECTEDIDLVIVCDCSTSLNEEELRLTQEFIVNDLISAVFDGNSVGRTQVGFITFAYEPHIEYLLTDPLNKLALQRAAKSCPDTVGYRDGPNTNIADSITEAAEMDGQRSDSVKIMVLISDGAENVKGKDGEYANVHAERAIEDGWTILAVGAGESRAIETDILEEIVSYPSYVWEAVDFDYSSIANRVIDTICSTANGQGKSLRWGWGTKRDVDVTCSECIALDVDHMAAWCPNRNARDDGDGTCVSIHDFCPTMLVQSVSLCPTWLRARNIDSIVNIGMSLKGIIAIGAVILVGFVAFKVNKRRKATAAVVPAEA